MSSFKLIVIMTPFYEPFEPTTLVCQPAAALFITKGGEVEIFSRECSKLITNLFETYTGTGRTLSLLDEKIFLVGNGDPGANSNQENTYLSIENPHDGLFGMKYSLRPLLTDGIPFQHVSLVSRNELFVLGGKYQTNIKYTRSGIWKMKPSFRQDGSIFLPNFIASCSVKIDISVHVIFGGKNNMKRVVKIDTDLEEVYEMKPVDLERMSHGCQLLTRSIVLLSGGLTSQGRIQEQDELYDIESEEVVKVLDVAESLRRYNHATIKMGEEIFALGGRDSIENKNDPLKVKVFNTDKKEWHYFPQDLLSSQTSDLVLTPYALSSLDCVRECTCGIVSKGKRIFGGSEAEVKKIIVWF